MWGEPRLLSLGRVLDQFQLTRPVWGEPSYTHSISSIFDISTHSPRVGRTPRHDGAVNTTPSFQLTRPVWGEPISFLTIFITPLISTHSPRVGRTDIRRFRENARNRFQLTRPVWGEPCTINGIIDRLIPFQLTRPVWGEPSPVYSRLRFQMYFNSLAPCGANRQFVENRLTFCQFQLTRPVWGEPQHKLKVIIPLRISTHSPRVGRTLCLDYGSCESCISTHSPRVGRTARQAQCAD